MMKKSNQQLIMHHLRYLLIFMLSDIILNIRHSNKNIFKKKKKKKKKKFKMVNFDCLQLLINRQDSEEKKIWINLARLTA